MSIVFPQNFHTVGIGCVLVGKFNPDMFSPAWLKYYKLVRDAEADEAKVSVIHPGLTQFVVANVTFIVQEAKFSISTVDQSRFEPLKDLVLGVLSLIESTPVTSMGMNTECHFRAKDEAAWNKFGDTVASKELWQKFVTNPGLKTITIQGNNTNSAPGGEINVKVEPSKIKANSVLIQINNHFAFSGSINAVDSIEALKSKWSNVIKDSFDKTVELAKLVD